MTDAPVHERPMKAKGHCARCGALLPADLTVAFCPQCELRGALDPLADLSGVSGPDPAKDSSSALAPFGAATALGAPDLLGPRRFGDYELLEEIARGGMGIVYRAHQVSLDRIVAVKTLLAGPLAGKDFIHRFRTEAAAAAGLHHPNIVAIYEVGFAEGQHFFAMDYVEGQTLAQLVAKGPLSPRQAAQYLQTIAAAIHFAHERNVLHRDLKPSNVLIDSATDQPRVTDFGLAKRLEAETDLTLTGQVLGSPNYMSPEQATARRRGVGKPSDVYSLGAILYHLLTGRAPFQGESLTDVLHQVMSNEPLAPRLLTPRVPRDLETICLKCLEKEPARRYPTAHELAEELGRFLRDEPVLARPVTRPERLWRWCRRKPVVASLTATSVVLLLAVAIGAPIMAYRINQARLVADQERLVADQERLQTRRSHYASDMRLASEALREGQFNHARELLKTHVPKRGEEDLRGLEWRYLAHEVQASKPVRILEGLPAPSHWDQTLLFRSDQFLYNQSSNQLKAWDMTTWEPLPIVPPAQPASVRWHWDPAHGSAYAVDHAQHSLAVYALPRFEPISTLRLPGAISTVQVSDAQTTLAVGYQEGASHRVMVWDLGRDAGLGIVGDSQAAITVLAFSPEGTRLAASSTNGIIGVWDLGTMQPLPAPPQSAGQVRRLQFTADNRRLLYGEYGNYGVWDIQTGQPFAFDPWRQGPLGFEGISPDARYFVLSWGGPDLTLLDSTTFLVKGTLRGSPVGSGNVKFSPDSKRIASTSADQTARVWDVATRTEVGIVGGFGQTISSVEFSIDGQDLVLIGGFGQIRTYRLSDVLNHGLFAQLPGKEPFINLAISPDERYLAAVSPEGRLAVWDRSSRRRLCSVSFPRYTPKSYPRVVFSPDGARVFSVTGDALRILQVESGEFSSTPIEGNREANAITFSPDGQELVFGCGRQLIIYDPASGQQRRFTATDDEVFAIGYSPDPALLAFGGRGGSLTLYERARGRVLWKGEAHPPALYGLDFSPNGRLLATSGADATIKLWRVQPDGLHLQTTLRGHLGNVNGLAFSPDGTRLVSPSADQTLKIWDPYRGAELATLYGHHSLAATVRFTEDGLTIYSTGMDGEIRFWEAPPLAEIDPSEETTAVQSRPTTSHPPSIRNPPDENR